jgi:hypothetical protein
LDRCNFQIPIHCMQFLKTTHPMIHLHKTCHSLPVTSAKRHEISWSRYRISCSRPRSNQLLIVMLLRKIAVDATEELSKKTSSPQQLTFINPLGYNLEELVHSKTQGSTDKRALITRPLATISAVSCPMTRRSKLMNTSVQARQEPQDCWRWWTHSHNPTPGKSHRTVQVVEHSYITHLRRESQEAWSCWT